MASEIGSMPAVETADPIRRGGSPPVCASEIPRSRSIAIAIWVKLAQTSKIARFLLKKWRQYDTMNPWGH
jgi:hypothetical protein